MSLQFDGNTERQRSPHNHVKAILEVGFEEKKCFKVLVTGIIILITVGGETKCKPFDFWLRSFT